MCARFLSLLPAIGAIAALSACSPMGTPAPAPAPADPATIHARILTLDTHLDTPVHFERRDWDFGAAHDFYSDMSQVDLPRMTEAGLDGGFFVLYTSQGPLTADGFAHAASAAEHRLAAIEATLNAHRDTITRVTSAGEAARVAHRGGHFALISVENSYPLGESVAGLADWRRRGVLMAGPVHNGGNQFGDSASGGTARWGGLSPLGRAWVAEMNRLGMVIDASHASDAALTQMLDLSAAPIILSHSGFKAIFDHPRNISDDQARAIAAKLGPMWGQQVIVETKAGVAGVLAADYVAQQPSDGTTLLMAHINSHALAPSLQPKMNYSVERDFVPIVLVGVTPNLLIGNPQLIIVDESTPTACGTASTTRRSCRRTSRAPSPRSSTSAKWTSSPGWTSKTSPSSMRASIKSTARSTSRSSGPSVNTG